MDKLERNIKKAFSENDAKTTFSRKDAMWNRLDATMHKPEGVAVIWKIAVVFLGTILITGVFAGLNFHKRQQQEIQQIQRENVRLQYSLDSLLNRPTEIQTETKIVEKVVYRDRPNPENANENVKEWQGRYSHLLDSMQFLIANRESSYKDEIARLERELNTVKTELAAHNKGSDQAGEQEENALFQLKGERVDPVIQKNPAVKNPEIELKVFPRNFIGNTNDLNKTLFKK